MPFIKHNPSQTLTQESNSYSFFIGQPEVNEYSALKSVALKLNELNQMNKQLANQVIEDLRNERASDIQLLSGLRKLNTPSVAKTIEEIEQKSKIIDTALKSFEDYISLTGIQLDGEKGQIFGFVAKSRRGDYVNEIVEAIPAGEEFDIHRVRDKLNQVHSKIFGRTKQDKKDFYPVYHGAMKELQEQKKIKVAKEGKGKRATVFVRI